MKTSASTYFNRVLLLMAGVLVATMVLVSCGSPRSSVRTPTGGGKYLGVKTVSWYGPGFHGKRTASGEVYDMHALTCAHKSMDFGSRLRIVNPENGNSVVVTVTDRGPFVRGRDIDLSREAASRLGILEQGTADVKVYYVDRDMRYATYIKDGKVEGRTPSASSSSTGTYTIQVASFRDRDSADYLKSGLELVHKKVYLQSRWVNGDRYYRVRVGRFDSEIKAFIYAKKLAFEGYPDVKVLTYE